MLPRLMGMLCRGWSETKAQDKVNLELLLILDGRSEVRHNN